VARALSEPVRRRLLDFPRQALHAARLGFAHPRTGQALSFTTEPPADIAGLIASLDCDLRGAQV
jgi:23S rRNA pseudouridine1911/1915/1917 synthase